MEFWFETDLRVDQHRDSCLSVEVPSDDWTWCANPIGHRRLPRGFSRRVSDIIGHFNRKTSVQISQHPTVSGVAKLKESAIEN